MCSEIFFEMDEGLLCAKQNAIAGIVENAIDDFLIGQENGTNRNNDNDYFDSVDKTPAKRFTKEDSLKTHSLEIFDFFNLFPIAH